MKSHRKGLSPKFLHRGLALGALMTFIITGNALAAEITTPQHVSHDTVFSGDTIGNMNFTHSSQYAINHTGGTLTIDDCVLENINKNSSGDNYSYGSVLYSPATGGKITINDSTIQNNTNLGTARRYAVMHITGDVDISDSVFKNNKSDYMGGALYLSTGNVTITNTIFENNSSNEGGAIIANGGSAGSSVKIINSTFKGNDSGSTGSGGALNAQGATVITLSGTNNFEGNTAANGGAINNYYNGSKIIFAEGSTTNFINNTATSGNGGAINNVIHAAAEDAVVEIHGDVNFSGNTANGVANDIYNEHTLKILGGTTTTEGGIISKGEKSSVELSEATLALTGGKTSLDTLTGTNGTIKFVKPEAELEVASNSSTGLGVAASGEVNDAVNGDASKLLQNVALNGDTALFMEAGDIVGEVSATLKTDEQGNLVVANKKEATNMDNKAIGEAGVALKAQWRAQMNDMNKRLGDLRNANGEQGVWTRMVRGEAEYQSVKAQYNQYQLGYDHKVGDQGWVLGAAVTYSEGDSTFYKGSTDDKSTAFAIYGSKLNDDGSFVDLIARYAHLKSDVTVTDDKADYSTDGYSVSAEYGKRFHDKAGFWVEPQVELTYGNMDGADYTIDGRVVHNGSMDSFIGRLGFSMGKDIKQGNVYARASYLYDFDGDTQTTFSKDGVSRTIKEDLGGGWWEVGVGTNINLSKATYVYADVEKTFGGEVDTNWQWNLGVRYSF